MADENQAEQPKTTGNFQLKDTSTSFYDDETGLEVTGDQVVTIKKGAGAKTLRMITSGGLVCVSEKPHAATGTQTEKTSTTSDLPTAPPVEKENNSSGDDGVSDELAEDFPGYRALSDAKITKRSQLAEMSDEDLQATKGIGPKTAADIRAALKE